VGNVARRHSWILGLAIAVVSPSALGREPTPGDRTTARELAFEGYAALHSGDYATAADRFKRADELVHAPTLLVDLGRSYAGLGRLVKAHEAFQLVLREGVPKDALASWRRALVVAETEDAKVAPRLAWVTIRAQGAEQFRLKLDDEELPPASLGVKRAVDPGRRTVQAEAEGFLPVQESIELGEGEVGQVELVLKRDPQYVRPAATPSSVRRVIVIERPASHERTPAYVAFGVGGAGLLLSGVSSILMLRANADLAKACPDRKCPPTASNSSEVSRYHSYGTLAAVGLGVALAGAGVGTYFWTSDKPKDGKASRYTVTARVSLGYVDVSGGF